METNQIQVSKFLEIINELKDIQKELIFIHPLFENYYPIVVADQSLLHVFDYDAASDEYSFVKTVPDDIGIPEQCLAAFPFVHYERKMCAVVTPEAFNQMEDRVFLYHEFVHCFVGNTCGNGLRDTLELARKAARENDIQWEIRYPFPYDNEAFVQHMQLILRALETGDQELARSERQELIKHLTDEQIDYWTWQEWNEGFARYLENKIRNFFQMPENRDGSSMPYDRITFYESGSLYIKMIIEQEPALHTDIEQLFYKMQADRMIN